jgi:hypothetical protein
MHERGLRSALLSQSGHETIYRLQWFSYLLQIRLIRAAHSSAPIKAAE